jgi:hypothetical protein
MSHVRSLVDSPPAGCGAKPNSCNASRAAGLTDTALWKLLIYG